MPEALIPVAFFALVALIVKWSLDYKRSKLEHGSGLRSAEDQSLHASELKALIREAVEEAQAPLAARLEAVEARLDVSEPGRPTLLLDGALDAVDVEPAAPSLHRERLA